MSWYRASRGVSLSHLRPSGLGLAVVSAVLSALTLAGCTSGFQPMYASSVDDGRGLASNLAQVRFETIPGRIGQRIRNELIFAATGSAAEPYDTEYRLEVAIRERTTAALVTATGDASSRIYNADAKFKLYRNGEKAPVLEGSSFGRAALQRYSSIYSNERALRDAQDRAARAIARDLRSRLEAFLATRV